MELGGDFLFQLMERMKCKWLSGTFFEAEEFPCEMCKTLAFHK